VAVDHAAQVSTLFYVDTLEFLRRGGRIGAASALLGTALSVKPILHIVDGAIVVRDKVRTAGRALARLWIWRSRRPVPVTVDIAVHPPGRRRTGRLRWPTRCRCAWGSGYGTATSRRSARWWPHTRGRASLGVVVHRRLS
jgi:hypothetical protein